jgi:hypothetical protein
MKAISRFASILAVLTLFLSSVGSVYGGTSPAPQDPSAVSLIQKVLNSNGLSTPGLLKDVNASGEVHHYWAGKDVVSSAQIYALGSDKFRFDSTGSTTETRRVGGMRGQIQLGQQKQPVAAAAFVITTNPILPVLELANALGDSNTKISYLGTTQPNTFAIGLERTRPDFSDFGAFTKVYLIDQHTLNIVQTIETVAYSLQDKVSRKYVYEDFNVVQGVTVPSTISEFMSGQNTWTLHLTNIAINVGVSSDLFTF